MTEGEISSSVEPPPRRPGTVEQGVLFGQDGWMFLADGGHAVLDFILGKRMVPEVSYANFERNITLRRATLRAADVPFLHLIFPDKQSVLEMESTVENVVCLGQEYFEHCPSLHDVILYPRQILKELREQVFMKTDTHVTDAAHVLVAGLIAERFSGESQAVRTASMLGLSRKIEHRFGDLGGRFDPPYGEDHDYIPRTWITKHLHNKLQGGNNGIVDIIVNDTAPYKKRLLIFGDSFARGFAGMLSAYFSTVLFLRTPFFHKEIFEQFSPDYVVTENAERYLSFCLPDDDARLFEDYPALRDPSYAPSDEFRDTLSSLLRSR